MLSPILVGLVYIAIWGVVMYFAVRFGVRHAMTDLEKRNRSTDHLDLNR
jgi:hypothetical protein